MQSTWDWRKHLTPDEKAFIVEFDKVNAKYRGMVNDRRTIVSRATQRARQAAAQKAKGKSK